MASLTIRNIPEDAKLRFRQVAAAHGRSMEDHLRQLVISAGADDAPELKGVRDMSPSFRHFEPDAKATSRVRVERLIELGRGIDWEPPKREVGAIKETDFS
jgi:hypothetical protein